MEKTSMGQQKIRLLYANEIECRVGMISEKGLSLLLYKDARCDMKILDEVYGSNNWQRSHELIGGNLYCTVSIWDDEKKQWVSKMDVGTKSNTEKEKGEASDSFKRACFSLGIGRELYTAPFIWIAASKVRLVKKEDRYIAFDKFAVSNISYNESREITGLTIINQDGQLVYRLADKAVNQSEDQSNKTETDGKTDENSYKENEQPNQIGNTQAEMYAENINRELQRTGVALNAVLQRYGIASIQEMNENTYKRAMNSLKRTKSRAA